MFDVLGWDGEAGNVVASTVLFRWNAAIARYELRRPEDSDWNRLEATAAGYDVFDNMGTKLPFKAGVSILPLFFTAEGGTSVIVEGFVGEASIHSGPSAPSSFAFGIATTPGDVPATGTLTCQFGQDEVGDGSVTVDLATGTVSGWYKDFWGLTRYPLLRTNFAASTATLTAAFSPDVVFEGRLFGPRAANIAVRAYWGGRPYPSTTILLGACQH